MQGYGLGVGPRFGSGFGNMYPGHGFMWGNRLGAKPNPAAAPRSTPQPSATAGGIQQAAQQQGVQLGNQANNNMPQGNGLEVMSADRGDYSWLANCFVERRLGSPRLVKQANGMFNASLPGAAPALGAAPAQTPGVNLQNTAKPQLPAATQSLGTNTPTSGLTNGSTLGAGSGGKSSGLGSSSGSSGATKLGSVQLLPPLGGVTLSPRDSLRASGNLREKAGQDLSQSSCRALDPRLPRLGMGSFLPQFHVTGKQASQDNSQPQLSATGESKGLAYAHKADDYDRGPDAWKNSGKYLRFGKRLTSQPDLERGRHQSHSKQAAVMPGQAVGPTNPVLTEPVAGSTDEDDSDERTLGGESPGQDAMFKTAMGGMFPAQVIRHIVPLEDRREQFTPDEDEQIKHHEQSWIPKFIQTDSTPIPSLLASPTKQGILGGLAGAAAGGLAGGLGGHLLGGHGALGAGLGALALGGLGASNAYRKRYFRNAHIKEILRRLPSSSTYRDYDTEERLLRAFKDRFKQANDEGDQFTDWLLAAWPS